MLENRIKLLQKQASFTTLEDRQHPVCLRTLTFSHCWVNSAIFIALMALQISCLHLITQFQPTIANSQR